MLGPVSGRKVLMFLMGAGLFLQWPPTLNSGPKDSAPLFPNPIWPYLAHSLNVADLNDDSLPDLISTSNVLMGKGAGEFQTVQMFSGVQQIKVADVDGDGTLDIVTSGEGGLRERLGRGDGSFSLPVSLGFDGTLGLLGDLDRDGVVDILGVDATGLYLLKGEGRGDFALPILIDTVPVGRYDYVPETGDFDGDGILDIALAGGPYVVRILLGSPEHKFRLLGSFQGANAALRDFVVEDFNKDGRSDIAVVSSADAAGEGVCILLSGAVGGITDCSTGFSPLDNSLLFEGVKQCYRAGNNSSYITTADFNKDGNIDLAVANTGISSEGYLGDLFVMLGDGTGCFTRTVIGAGIRATAVEVADFNEDDNPDLAVTSTIGELALLYGAGDGINFRQLLTQEAVTGAAVGDVNNDDHDDIITPEAIFLAKGSSGRFERKPLGAASRGRMLLGDLNHDRFLDLAGCADGEIEILLGRGKGAFDRPRYTASAACKTWWRGTPLSLGDMNADGNLDLMMAGGVGFGRGDGTFDEHPWPIGGVMLASADFDSDGFMDAALYLEHTRWPLSEFIISLVRGGKNGLEQKEGVILSDYGFADVSSMVAGDVNKDGNPDLLVSTEHDLLVILGVGDATFTQPRSYSSTCFAVDMRLADFDGDGNIDSALTGSTEPTCPSSGVSILFGDGSGGFPSQSRFATGVSLLILPGDFNGDGRTDLVGLGGYSQLSLLLNQGHGPQQHPRK